MYVMYITRSSCASPASPASVCVCVCACACACACGMYGTLAPRPHPPPSFGTAAAPAVVQIPLIAHEHATALLPHPVSIYLSLPCLPRLSRPCATRCLDPHPRPHTLTPIPSHPIPILALRLCARLLFCALLPSCPPCLANIFTTALQLASSLTRHAVRMSLISSSPSNESAQETTNYSPLATKWTCFPS